MNCRTFFWLFVLLRPDGGGAVKSDFKIKHLPGLHVQEIDVNDPRYTYDGPPALNCDNSLSMDSARLMNFATNTISSDPVVVPGRQIAVLNCATPNVMTAEITRNLAETRRYAELHGYQSFQELRNTAEIWADAWYASMREDGKSDGLSQRGRVEHDELVAAGPKIPAKGLPHARWNSYAKLYTIFASHPEIEYIFYLDADNFILRPDIALQTFISATGMHMNRSVVITAGTTKYDARYGSVPRFQGSTILFRRTPWTMWFLRGVVGLGWEIRRWIPKEFYNDKWLHQALYSRIEYVPNVSGFQMNQNLWLAAYYNNWQGTRREICPYRVPNLDSRKPKPFYNYTGSSIFPIRIFCAADDVRLISKKAAPDRPPDPRMMSHCFAKVRREENYTQLDAVYPSNKDRPAKLPKVSKSGKKLKRSKHERNGTSH